MYCGELYNINCDKIIMEAMIIKYDCKYQFFKYNVSLGNILYFSKICNHNIQLTKII